MGLDPHALPENILRRMPKSDRAPLGKAGRTSAEANAVADKRAERQLQKDIANLLNQRNLFFDCLRMDKRTRSATGRPDFYIFLPGGKYLAVEVKVHGGKLTTEQYDFIQLFWDKTQQVVHIIFNLQQFRELLDRYHP